MTAAMAHLPCDSLSDICLTGVFCYLENTYCPQHWGFQAMLKGQEETLATSCDTQGETQTAIYANACGHFWKYKYISLILYYPI